MPTLELLREPTPPNQGELAWRLGLVARRRQPAAARHRHCRPRTRATPSNWNLLFALLGFVVYYNLINLSQAWVGSGRIGIGTALLAAHGGAFVLALALLWWREHGMRSRGAAVRARRRAGASVAA